MFKVVDNNSKPAMAYGAITPHDSTNFARPCRGIYVGGAGTIVAVMRDGTAVTFAGCLAGTVLPIVAIRVNSTSTTATNLVALY